MPDVPDVFVGIDVGGTKCAAVLMDVAGRVLAEHRSPTPRGADPLIAHLLRVVEVLHARAGSSADVSVGGSTRGPVALGGVGIGLPGLVAPDGVLRFAGHLPGVVDLPVRQIVQDALRVQVVVMNDNRGAAWGEYRMGAGRGVDELLYVGFGTGIGGGYVRRGELLQGAHGFATEIGHITIDVDGPICSCGRTGCWELYASGNGLGALARQAVAEGRLTGTARSADASGVGASGVGASGLRGEDVTGAAAAGEAWALSIIGEYAVRVAEGLSALTMVFDPARIVLGGGVLETVKDGIPIVLKPVRDALGGLLGHGAAHRPIPVVAAAALGPLAGAIGAGLLACAAVGAT